MSLGVVLILAGLGAFLQASGLWLVTNRLNSLLVVCLLLVIGLLLISRLANHRNQWWPIIPSCALFSAALIIGLNVLFPQLSWLSGSVFLGLLGLGFFLVYFFNRQCWWAIIPGGVLLTLSTIPLVSHFVAIGSGIVFFLGLAVTFTLVYYLPGSDSKNYWARIPAIVMLAMAALISMFTGSLANFLWPLILVFLGFIFILRSFKTERSTFH